MTQKKILDYFIIEEKPGGNQDWLTEWDMNMGGCAAVTACDVCIFLARSKKFRSLFPFENDPENLSRCDFINFSTVMKPYLTPRYHGIDLLEIYICGFYDYMKSIKNDSLILEGVSGNADYEFFSETIIDRLNNNFPVPYLMLHNHNQELDDFEWHWFNLAGYEKNDNEIKVMTVTYGEFQWFDLKKMYETGYERRGGIIKILEK